MKQMAEITKTEFLAVRSLMKCCFRSTETIGLLGMGAQDGQLDFHTAPEFCKESENGKLYIL